MKNVTLLTRRSLCLLLVALALPACGAEPEADATEPLSSTVQAVGGTVPVTCPQDRPVLCEVQCDRSNCARCCLARQRCETSCSVGGYATCRCS